MDLLRPDIPNTRGFEKDIPESREPQITVAGDNVDIIWTGFGSGVEDQDDVFFKKSSDGGATFSDTINLSKNIGSPFTRESLYREIMFLSFGRMYRGNTGILVLLPKKFRRRSDL